MNSLKKALEAGWKVSVLWLMWTMAFGSTYNIAYTKDITGGSMTITKVGVTTNDMQQSINEAENSGDSATAPRRI